MARRVTLAKNRPHQVAHGEHLAATAAAVRAKQRINGAEATDMQHVTVVNNANTSGGNGSSSGNSGNGNSGKGRAVQEIKTTCLVVVAMPAAGFPSAHWDLLLAFRAYSSGFNEFSLSKIILQTTCFHLVCLLSLEFLTDRLIDLLFRLGPLLACSRLVHPAFGLLFGSSSS